ncbi:MAG: ribosome biogenesis/translation initiation ATPase RLI [Thermoplasmata archaeon]|nr:MAG: ribosome biogenesis/translation initiation ATPase RLI [Thermoplasmata archaeon]RLF36058.1 MAG: ribosome biogenesis/translation initiation ATPase RLI [Thermoplasmata archaeon]
MRIAVLLKERCRPKRCSLECIKYCPRVRAGDETIVMGEDNKPVISEELCVGCGICVHKCPYDAIKIIGLAHELETDLVHQFSRNGFRLFRLPVLRKGICVGVLGPNGIGKTTAIKILSGQLKPNLGNYEKKSEWDDILEYFSGTELYEHFRQIANNEVTSVLKPQYVDKLPRIMRGKIRDILKKTDTSDGFDEVVEKLGLTNVLDKEIERGVISGGELQMVSIAAALLKDVDLYFFDEPSSYLDIHQRLKVARIIKELSEKKKVMVVEHDLAVMDFLCDSVHIVYGDEGAYGVITNPRGVRHAINTYLSGYLKEENIRFGERIEFFAHPPRQRQDMNILITFGRLTKSFNGFNLSIEPGVIRQGEIVGVVGPNAIGKTTFVKILAGVIKPTAGEIDYDLKISYKPQYITPWEYDISVREFFETKVQQLFTSAFLKAEIFEPMNLKHILDKQINNLSGGELQRVAIALSLAQEADIYMIDEPSAYLDSQQRMIVSRTIRRVVEKTGKSAMVVDHDVYFIDMVSDALIVFDGEPGKHGRAQGPFSLHEGMNRFLKDVDITFRRDEETHRPRVNKPGSYMDRKQREIGEYYYTM